MTDGETISLWHVVYSKPRQEAVAESHLSNQGYETFLPYHSCWRRQRHERILKQEPLFPRYLFCQLREGVDSYSPIRSTRGVIDLVRFAGQPAVIANDLVAQLRLLEQQQLLAKGNKVERFISGDRVRIMQGPFAGYEALFEKSKPQDRAVVLLAIAERQTRLHISQQQLEQA